jgi:GDPmannose 4,6-dehydratase
VNYRESFGMFAVSGILFNHESPRRGSSSSRARSATASRASNAGCRRSCGSGNLDARRDWGFAGDYVDAMWRMLQQPEPDDYVIGTGVTWSVRDFCEAAFSAVGLDYREHVVQDERFFRPAEVDLLVADPARRASGSAGRRR